MNHSQYGQDSFVNNYFNNKTNGYFVEVGAFDGKTFSNTFLLEKNGWKGICIEPNPFCYDDIHKNRSCIIDNNCISDGNHTIEFLASSICSSGINNENIVKLVKRNFERNLYNKKEAKKLIIKTKTLTQILNNYNSPIDIDYISIDVEGHELSVLKGIDYNKYKIKLISVEMNSNKIIEYLKTNFNFVKKIKTDVFFENKIKKPLTFIEKYQNELRLFSKINNLHI
jgi:FkbM family methyltransferase